MKWLTVESGFTETIVCASAARLFASPLINIHILLFVMLNLFNIHCISLATGEEINLFLCCVSTLCIKTLLMWTVEMHMLKNGSGLDIWDFHFATTSRLALLVLCLWGTGNSFLRE
jgi:hypothetical protein